MKKKDQAGNVGCGGLIVLTLIVMVVFGLILQAAGYKGNDSTSDDTTTSCEAQWTIHRNDTLIGYTHSDYIKECVSSAKAVDQYFNDHR